MTAPLLYVTGTNTAVGKTTLAKLLLGRARERKIPVAAIKPFCSGGREDAEQLHALQTANLTLDELNPFYFDEPIAPYVAARNAGRAITLEQTLSAIEKVRARNHPVLIEGAGGLMSPLGEEFTLLDIIAVLRGKIIIVGPNVLGVINSALLTHRALTAFKNLPSRFVLMTSANPDASAPTNPSIIREWTNVAVDEIPFLPNLSESSYGTEPLPFLDDLLNWWINH